MKPIYHVLIALAAFTGQCSAQARSTPIDVDSLTYETVHDVAERSILAKDASNRPLVVLLRLDDGDFLPPHGAQGGLRLLTVLSGELSWGDGDEVDPNAERIFGPGAILVVPAEGGEHWAAARNGPVVLQVVFVRDGGTLTAR
ncbi:MAG: hypothetical protein KDE63_06145 [Novosphingobium sp.]|nr:hypothetical protein [Novosphingobium sp.]